MTSCSASFGLIVFATLVGGTTAGPPATRKPPPGYAGSCTDAGCHQAYTKRAVVHGPVLDTPCSACHDPHGICSTVSSGSDHTHLINFDTTIVRPEPGTGRLEFRDKGHFAASCTLLCHGEVREDADYD